MSIARRRGALQGKDTFSNNFFADLRISPLMDLYHRIVIEAEEVRSIVDNASQFVGKNLSSPE